MHKNSEKKVYSLSRPVAVSTEILCRYLVDVDTF